MREYLSVITRKGQVTIPAEIRRTLDLKEGDTIAWLEEGGVVRITPARFTLESAFGSVEPRQRPEDFEELTSAAKSAKARTTAAELTRDEVA